MAREPAGPRRNDAMRTANEALLDAQNAMLALPQRNQAAQQAREPLRETQQAMVDLL